MRYRIFPAIVLIFCAAALLCACRSAQTSDAQIGSSQAPESIVSSSDLSSDRFQETPGASSSLPTEPSVPTELSVPTEPSTPPPPSTTPSPADVTPPEVSGEDFEVTAGESVSYKSRVTVSDDRTAAPRIEIDASGVDLDVPGVYRVYYVVVDDAGNETHFSLQVTVKEKPPVFTDEKEEFVYNEVRRILAEITTDDMNDMQKAYAVYYWTRNQIAYTGSSDKSDPITGAYNGLKTRKGDCYTYFSVAKAFLQALHIDTIDVEKLRTSEKQNRHYWLLINIGTGWYHFDANPFTKFRRPYFFMATDAEIKKWDATYYRLAHNYDPSLYPEIAVESVQSLIDYSSPTLKLPKNA